MLKAKFVSLIKSEFVVALSTASFTTVIQMLVGLVINKILAITIGPAGIAMMGQFTNYKDLVTNLANGSLGQGVTKYIADSKVETRCVIATSNIFTLVVSILISVFVIFYANYWSELLFKDIKYAYIFKVFGFTIPFFAFNNILLSTVNGFFEFKTLAKLKITSSLVALVISSSMVWFFLLEGALFAQAINTSIVFIISYLLIRRNSKEYFSFNYLFFDKKVLRKLMAFTLMALVSTQLKPIVQLIIRDYIIVHAGSFEAGIWEATKKLSDYYTQVITVALGAYYLPKLSSLSTSLQLKKEIYKGILTIIPVFFVIALSIYVVKGWVVKILFSSDFIPMIDLIAPQLMGDFFMIISFMIAYLMLAKVMILEFIISQVVFASTRILFSITLFKTYGIEGIIWANALNYFIYFCFVLFLFRKILFLKSNTKEL